jgi:hypothetical protein
MDRTGYMTLVLVHTHSTLREHTYIFELFMHKYIITMGHGDQMNIILNPRENIATIIYY